MSTVQEIEAAISKLSPNDLRELRGWFEAFDTEAWDEQIEKDAKAGRLDHLIEEARRDYRNGQCSEL